MSYAAAPAHPAHRVEIFGVLTLIIIAVILVALNPITLIFFGLFDLHSEKKVAEAQKRPFTWRKESKWSLGGGTVILISTVLLLTFHNKWSTATVVLAGIPYLLGFLFLGLVATVILIALYTEDDD